MTAPAALAPAPFRAFVLEDHEFQRRIAVQVLRDCGATEVLEAAEGGSALELFMKAEPQIEILLCDLNMPGMDGLAFLRYLAEAGGRSAVILTSALDSSIIRSAEIMADHYGVRIIGVVEKPLSRGNVMPLILRHFSQGIAKSRPKVEMMAASEIASGLVRREFEPYFQPKVDIRTGAMVGVEALMRWSHPTRGMVSPAAFIQVMEANGLLSDATFTLIEMSLAHHRHWKAAGLDVPIAINFSFGLLSDTGLPDRLEMLTRAAGLRPEALTIEITETVALSDIGHSLETLARCRMKGFAISIDDYGTGFSSMQQLTRLPLSELKIDQSFVTGAANDPALCAMIETSVTLANRLKLKTVAEGVETPSDWELVARLGCAVAQGFLIGKPMPADRLPSWEQRWRTQGFEALRRCVAEGAPIDTLLDLPAG